MRRNSKKTGFLEKKRQVIADFDSDDSDTFINATPLPPKSPKSPNLFRPVARQFQPLKSPQSPLVFRPIARKRPAEDSTTTLHSKGDNWKTNSTSSAAGSMKNSKTVYNRLPIVAENSFRRERDGQDNSKPNGKQDNKKSDMMNGNRQVDRNVAGPSSYRDNRQSAFSSSAFANSSPTDRYPNPTQQRNQPTQSDWSRFDDDREDEENMNAILGQFGTMINKRLNAKKVRIEKAFQVIVTHPNLLFENRESNAGERMQKNRKYESAMNKFKDHTESIMKKHEGHTILMHQMMTSISKGVSKITQNMAAVRDGTRNCFESLIKVGESYVKIVEKSGKESVEKYEEGLENWKQECLDEVDDQALDCLESIVKYI